MKLFRPQPATSPAWPHTEKGQSLVEIAIAIPFLIAVVIGVLDLGRMYFTVIIINNAAREGARYLMLHPDDRANGFNGTRAAARREAEGTIVTLVNADITPWCEDNDVNDNIDACSCTGSSFPYSCPVRVTVTADFDPILWPGNLTFSRKVEMQLP